LVFNEVKSPSTKEPITTMAKDSDIVKKVTDEIKVYTEEDHLASVDDKVYTATPTRRFMKRCKNAKVNWAIFSDKYGIWFSDTEQPIQPLMLTLTLDLILIMYYHIYL
jgi:hypothetical protein